MPYNDRLIYINRRLKCDLIVQFNRPINRIIVSF